jgi:translocation and assembly module TamB
VYFSEGISLVTNPITADVVWDGERVQVPQALAAGFVGNGVLDVVLDQGPPDITNVDLNVQLLDYTIATLLEDLPPLVNVNGSADFQGKIVGALTSLRIFGQLQVKELGVNELDFEPLLVGNLDFNPRGVGIELAGHQDQVRLGLTPEFEPTTAFVRLNQGTVQMQRDGDLYGVQIDRFPIALLPLELPEQLADQPLQGTASGQFDLALDPFNASGIFAIDQPTIGYVQAQRLQSQFRLVDNVITLENGFMQVRDSRFTFGGRGVLADDPQFELNVAVSQGDVQDVLRTLQWFDLVDVQRGLEGGLGGLQPALFDRAADVALAPLGNPRDPLRLQLHRFAEVKAKIGQTIRQRQAQKRLPPLTALAGRFDGEIKLAGSASQGVNADFNFGGDNWRWGDYTAQDLEIRGEFANNQVTLRPVRMVVEDAPISFVGTIGGEEQSGQFRVEQLPLALVQDFVDLPLDVDGAIELSANLAGSATDPQVLGELNLVDGTLNQEPLQTRNTGFNYLNGRFGFGSVLTVETDQSEPVVVSGSIPLPFGEIQPDSDELSLDLQVKNQGLELMNLLTQDQLSWLGGEGTVELQVRGTVQEPIATGTIQLNQAKMAAQVLPDGESITDLSGTIRFVQDRIQVETLTGSFSEGEITAQGMLPIALPFGLEDPDRETPLQVNIDNLNLNLPGIYRGGADGQVQVRGSLRDPSLTGAIQLSQGNIPLPDTEAVALAPAPPPETNGSNTFVINPLVFDNLRLQLQDKVEVASPPVFRFRAEGELLVNGTIDEIQPDGEIRLTRGQVSLFTTNFTLARRHKNVAVFRPETGLEPDLDVRMVAAVTEVSNRAPTAGPLTNSEIADTGSTDFSELETIRIRAEVQGPASKLLSNLELSSRPARSQSELYALMGGGFITTLGQGGDGTLALANFAGSALINSLQARINDALQGPVDFRLFPTLVDSNDRREQAEGDSNDSSGAETLALGAEVGVNLTNSLSFSVLRLLTVDIPTRFNVRYQITDNWQLRGTSDLQGDNRFVVEYEARF